MQAEEAEFRRAELATLGAAFPGFELIALLGRGGMGEVYKARQKKLNRLVAIKILPEPFGKLDEFTERFRREAQSLARLNHPNIVTIYDYGEANGLCYLVMEFVDGVDLRQTIEAKTLTAEEALRIVPQVCDALQFAHDQGIVHRDIKPANILLDKTGRVKIADFGLAKIVGKSPTDLTLTAMGDVMGTPEYMAPEQRRASQTVDHRADIYSLGVVFYEMLTGEVPMGRFEPPSHKVTIDIRLDDVVLRTLEREPGRRYQKVSEVKSGVETITAASRLRPMKKERRFPLGFTALWTLLSALLWFFLGEFWRWEGKGVIAGGFVLAAFIGLALYTARQRFPIIAERWRAESWPWRAFRVAGCITQSIVVVALVLSATLNLAERTRWPHSYLKGEKFAAQYKGEEYKLLRELKAYKTEIPKAELAGQELGWNAGIAFLGTSPPNHRYFSTFSILAQLFLALILLANSVNALVATDQFRLRVDPHWRRTIWPIAVLSFALCAGWCAKHFVVFLRDVAAMGATMRQGRASVAVPLADVEKTLTAKLKSEGFRIGESRQWKLMSVPEGRDLGGVRIANFWKPSPFDRWAWHRGWLVPISPLISVRYLASEKPLETQVEITVTPRRRQDDPASQALLQSLKATVESATKQ